MTTYVVMLNEAKHLVLENDQRFFASLKMTSFLPHQRINASTFQRS